MHVLEFEKGEVLGWVKKKEERNICQAAISHVVLFPAIPGMHFDIPALTQKRRVNWQKIIRINLFECLFKVPF